MRAPGWLAVERLLAECRPALLVRVLRCGLDRLGRLGRLNRLGRLSRLDRLGRLGRLGRLNRLS